MSTLFKQDVRTYSSVEMKDVELFLEDIKSLSEKHKLPIENVLEAYKIKEMERTNDLYVNNGNAHDEQMSGIGELLKELVQAVESLKTED